MDQASVQMDQNYLKHLSIEPWLQQNCVSNGILDSSKWNSSSTNLIFGSMLIIKLPKSVLGEYHESNPWLNHKYNINHIFNLHLFGSHEVDDSNLWLLYKKKTEKCPVDLLIVSSLHEYSRHHTIALIQFFYFFLILLWIEFALIHWISVN